MRRSVKRIILIAVFALFFLILSFGFINANAFAIVKDTTITQRDDLGFEIVGNTITVENKTVEFEGKTYDVQPIVIYPSGKAYRTNEVEISEAGKYEVEYRIIKDGAVIKTEREWFTAYEKNYVISGDGSAEYTALNGEEGLKITLKEDSSISFRKVIDLSEVTEADALVNALIVPSVSGQSDFKKLIFRFEDIYAPSNVLTISVAANLADGDAQKVYAYALAGAGSQTLSGYEKSNNTLHRETWGAPFPFSFWGESANKVSLRIDMQSKQVFAQLGVKIIDLDDKQYFSVPWSGFTTGQVRLTVTADEYSKTDASFFISNLWGIDLSDEYLIPDSGPEITVDYEGYETDGLPDGVTGCGYKVFDAQCSDEFSLQNKITAIAYRNYGKLNSSEVLVKDGYFYPDAAGTYVIEYTAENVFGLKTVVLSPDITVKDSPSPIFVNVSSIGRVTQGKVGEFITVPSYTVAGGDGKIEVTISVTSADGETVLSQNGFIPMSAGTYSVIYEAVDHNGNSGMYAYDVEVELYDGTVFVGDPDLPEYLRGGHSYGFPSVTGINYATGRKVSANVKVVFSDGTEALPDAEGILTIPAEKGGDNAKIAYYYGNDCVEYSRCVISAKTEEGKLDIAKYFLTDSNTSITATESGLLLSAVKDGTVRFVQEVLSQEFFMSFSVIPAFSGYKTLTITLTDKYDSENKIDICLINESSYAYVSVNGQTGVQLTNGFSSSQSNSFDLQYENGRITVGGLKISISDSFSGFSEGVAYLALTFSDVKGDSAIVLKSLNGQQINSKTLYDTVKPGFSLLDDFGGVYRIGSEVNVSRAVAKDVLSPYATVCVTVTDPDGNVVTSAEGVRLEKVEPKVAYSISLDKYGYYTVLYNATDGTNNRTYQYRLNVIDFSSPEIKLSDSVPKELKSGEKFTLPQASIEKGVEATVYLYVVDAQGVYHQLSNRIISVTFSDAGIYRLIYLAVAESGASTTCIYEIVVK